MRILNLLLAVLCLCHAGHSYGFNPAYSIVPAQRVHRARLYCSLRSRVGETGVTTLQKRTGSGGLGLTMVAVNPGANPSGLDAKLEEDHVWVDMNNVLGSGTFGEVFEAVIVDGPRKGTRAVAKRARTKALNQQPPRDHSNDEPYDGTTAARVQQAWEQWCDTVWEAAPVFLEVESYINTRCHTICPQVVAPYLGTMESQGSQWLLWEHVGTVQTLETVLEACHEAKSLKPLATGLGMQYEDGQPSDFRRLVNEAARQLLVCCSELQKAGIAHRDIKPSNVIIAHHQMLLIDFGAAAVMGDIPMVGYDYTEAPGDGKYCPPERFIDELEWTKYDVYCVGLTLLRILMPPFRAEAGFAQFRQIFRAVGHDIDAWFADLILSDPNIQTVQGKNRAELPNFGFPRQGERIREYERLAGLSCVMQYCDEHGTPPLSLCALKEGLAALSNDHVEGLVWDILHSILQPEPCLRPSASEALRQLSGERSRRGDRGQHPHGWERRWDAHQGRHYYANHITKVTQWQVPREWQSDAAAIIAAYTE